MKPIQILENIVDDTTSNEKVIETAYEFLKEKGFSSYDLLVYVYNKLRKVPNQVALEAYMQALKDMLNGK